VGAGVGGLVGLLAGSIVTRGVLGVVVGLYNVHEFHQTLFVLINLQSPEASFGSRIQRTGDEQSSIV
jgi:hypothetical protein